MAARSEAPSEERQEQTEGLQREVGVGMLSIYGAGTILGAGIYVLIGEVAGVAGYWLPLAFLLAAGVAIVNGMAYAELSTRMPKAGGPSAYVQKAFDARWFSVAIGWAIVATGIVSAATIASGFSGYLNTFFSMPSWLVQILLLTVLAGVAVAGAKQSAWFMTVTTALGVLGLVIVMGVGFLGADSDAGRVLDRAPSIGDPSVLIGLASAAFLAVYAFIGFEDMVHMAEEVKRPGRNMPIAIGIAVGAAALLYVVVSVAALAVAEPQTLRDADAPLVEVAQRGGFPGWPVAVLSLWIILNGALAQIIMASRVTYSLGDRDAAPGWLASTWSKTDTPAVATVAAAAVAAVMSIALPLKQLASITSFIMLVIFAASNVALIVLERRNAEAPFDTPRWLPWVGLVVTVALMVATFAFDGGGH